MLNMTSKQLKSPQIRKGLPHLYKRFLRLQSFIDISTSTITRSKFIGIYAFIIRSRFQVVYAYPEAAYIELVGDTDMFMKLRNIKEKYGILTKKDRKTLVNKELDTLLLNNYLHYSIDDFVGFYNMLLKDIIENEGKYLNWILTKNISVIENPNDVSTVRNNLLYGSIFKFDASFYIQRTGATAAWRGIFKTTYPFSAGMKTHYEPMVIQYRKNLNDHTNIKADYKSIRMESIVNDKNAFNTNTYSSIDVLPGKLQQRSTMLNLIGLKHSSRKAKQYVGSVENIHDYALWFQMLHHEITLHNSIDIQKRYFSYLNYDSMLYKKKETFTTENKEQPTKRSKRKSAKKLKLEQKKLAEIQTQVVNKSDDSIKPMVEFLEANSKNLDTMKYGAISFTHNVLTSEYFKKKFVLPYIRDELT